MGVVAVHPGVEMVLYGMGVPEMAISRSKISIDKQLSGGVEFLVV